MPSPSGVYGWRSTGARLVLALARTCLPLMLGLALADPAGAQPTRAVTVEWDPNTEADLAGYIVMAGADTTWAEQQIDVGRQTKATLALDATRRHLIWVHAYNVSGLMSLPSNAVEVGPDPGAETDSNGNGLPDWWEREYGVSDPSADPDADGLTTRQEWDQQTDPLLPNRWVLAEGAAGYFEERLALVNPRALETRGTLTLLDREGNEQQWPFTVPPRARRTIDVNALPGRAAAEASLVVEVQRGGVAVERTMRWSVKGEAAAGHTGKPAAAPSTTWLLAEGDARFFETWLLFANDTTSATEVQVDYLREDGVVISRAYRLAPRSRATVLANAVPGVGGRLFSTRVRSGVPVSVDRAMYFRRTGRGWQGGHATGAVSRASRTWLFAEGRTGPVFDTWLLLGNPQPEGVEAEVTWLRPDGPPVRERRVLPPTSRTTIHVDGVAGLRNTDVSMAIAASAPIVAERAMYWPGAANTWVEGHVSAGTPEAGTTWLLAEGQAGGPQAHDSYVLVANPGTTSAAVTLSFFRETGMPVTTTRIVAPQSRLTLSARDLGLATAGGTRFGVLVDADVPIVVERSMYWNAEGIVWRGGTNEMGLRLR